jgi:hypothetical protein
MARVRRLRWAASMAAVGALAVGLCVSTGASAATGAAPGARPTVGSGMRPSAGNPSKWRKAGFLPPPTKPNSSVVFSCQKPNAPLVCYGPDQLRAAYGFDQLIKAGHTPVPVARS